MLRRSCRLYGERSEQSRQWAQAFQGAKRLTERQKRLMSKDLRWRLIQKYIPRAVESAMPVAAPENGRYSSPKMGTVSQVSTTLLNSFQC